MMQSTIRTILRLSKMEYCLSFHDLHARGRAPPCSHCTANGCCIANWSY